MTLSAKDWFEAGDLGQAIGAMNDEVRSHPADVNRRGFLAELLCFTGALDRADLMLDVMGKQDPAAAVGIAMFRQQIRAALARQECFADGRVPEMLDEPPEHLRLYLEALAALRAGDTAEAARLAGEAETNRPAVKGTLDDKEFDDLRDVDDMTAGFFEVITSTGKYFWIPTERIEFIEFRPPAHPRDLLWRRAQMSVAGGPDGEVFIPAIYPSTTEDTGDNHRLGRATDWIGGDGEPVRGVGQRTFLVGDDAVPMMEMVELTFAIAG